MTKSIIPGRYSYRIFPQIAAKADVGQVANIIKEPAMFGMGMSELIVVLVIALIVIGPKKLPELAKTLGKAMGEFKRATNDFKDSISIDDPPKSYRPIDVYPSVKAESIKAADQDAAEITVPENTGKSDTADEKQP
jgi:TatA/E family protein of Tat protein translocase